MDTGHVLGLTGERRSACLRQLIILGVILAAGIAAIPLMKGFASYGTSVNVNYPTQNEWLHRSHIVMAIVAAALFLQFLYALIRKETFWQLRRLEQQASRRKGQ